MWDLRAPPFAPHEGRKASKSRRSRNEGIPEGPGYNTNFFSGRVYDPQALFTDQQTVTIVFAGNNTPQPSDKLGDYRSIGRFQLQFPVGYVSPF